MNLEVFPNLNDSMKLPHPVTKVPVQVQLCITSGLSSIGERLLYEYKKYRTLNMKGKSGLQPSLFTPLLILENAYDSFLYFIFEEYHSSYTVFGPLKG